jgi:5-methyltetrahydrofolate--homocysteine methyltransferase
MSGKVVLMDGAVGTSLWEKTEDKVPVWRYNIENPDIVRELHEEYIDAGAEIILANTFAANGSEVARASSYTVDQIVSTGVKIAKDTVRGRAKVALSIGPLTGLLEPFGEIPIEKAKELFEEQIESGVKEAPDLIYIQTFFDLKMIEIAAEAADRAGLPILCSMSFMGGSKKKKKSKKARTIMGNTVKDIVASLSRFENVCGIGLNCSMGPVEALPIVKEFKEESDMPIVFKPNAGKPALGEDGLVSGFDIETFAEDVSQAADLGATYIGGCCGANAAYIKRLGERIRERAAGR